MYNLPSRCSIVSDLEQAGVVSHQSRIIFYTGKGLFETFFSNKSNLKFLSSNRTVRKSLIYVGLL